MADRIVFSSCRDVSRASVGEASVKHSCEDELALTVAFVLTLHTAHTHKWMNKKMCADDMWKYTSTPPLMCSVLHKVSRKQRDGGAWSFHNPYMQSALTSTLSSTNTLTLLVSLQVRKKVIPQNIYTCILLTHLSHHSFNGWNGTPQFKMLPIGVNSQKSSVVQTRFRSEAFMTSVRRGFSLTVFSWTYCRFYAYTSYVWCIGNTPHMSNDPQLLLVFSPPVTQRLYSFSALSYKVFITCVPFTMNYSTAQSAACLQV